MLLILPILIPLLTAISALLLHRAGRPQRLLGVAGAAALLAAAVALLRSVWLSGVQVLHLGGWPAPFGITFVADLFSAIMVLIAALLGTAVALYALVTIDDRRVIFGFYELFHLMLMGVCGAFLTGDLFNLYVWFEVLLIASFVLLALGGEREQLEGGIPYVTLNLISSALFLAAVGILYAETGTLNMADLARQIPTMAQPGLVTALATLLMIAFGIKAAFFPLFFWLPAAYHTPPVAVSAIFAGLLTKVGVYAMIRSFTLIFTQDGAYLQTIILVAAGLTMIVGGLGAISQLNLRRVLSFLIISHIGFAIMGLGLFTPFALAGSIFYMIEDMLVLTALFMVAGLIRKRSGTEELRALGGFYRAAPALALLFLLPALSLAGIPPLSGFFAKLALLRAALESGQYAIVAVALAASLLTLFTVSMLWSEIFWKAPAQPLRAERPPARGWERAALWGPVVALAALVVLLGLFAEPVFTVTLAAGEQLYDPAVYIEAVLGEAP